MDLIYSDEIRITATESYPFTEERASYAGKEGPRVLLFDQIDQLTGQSINEIEMIIKAPEFKTVDQILCLRKAMVSHNIEVVPMKKYCLDGEEYLLMPNLRSFGGEIIDKDFLFRVRQISRFADYNAVKLKPKDFKRLQQEISTIKNLDLSEIRFQLDNLLSNAAKGNIELASDDPFHIFVNNRGIPKVLQIDISKANVEEYGSVVDYNIEITKSLIYLIQNLQSEVRSIWP